jgi:uncharacterized protein with von Willebrand factor type A (vWA) domain
MGADATAPASRPPEDFDLPLFELFLRLRDCELPLGIPDYQALIRALQGGFGLVDRASLLRLCRTLWSKSLADSVLIDWHFSRILPTPPTGSAQSGVEPRPTSASDEQSEVRGLGTQEVAESGRQSPQPLLSGGVPLSLRMTADLHKSGWMSFRPRASSRRYRFPAHAGRYLPLTQRQMTQRFRELRLLERSGPLTELDVRATVDKYHRHGLFLEPVLVPARRNRLDLVLLIDRQGSMVPFHSLANCLLSAAQRGGRFRSVDVFYFHDQPGKMVFRNPQLSGANALASLLERWGASRPYLCIVSDAGAARGHFDERRLGQTMLFLRGLAGRARSFTWLNPMPRHRWCGTTAGEIANWAPMFELSPDDVRRAMASLRGMPVQTEAAMEGP